MRRESGKMKFHDIAGVANMLAVALVLFAALASGKDQTLLNASYDATREFYHQFNRDFASHWREKTGQTVTIKQSHGGSGKQARAVIDGLQADVATLALAYDIDMLAQKGRLLPTNWQSRLPHNSSPFYSTIVFVVRAANPKGIKDWPDLVRPGVSVITPNPKTSGGARWTYLAAYGFELKRTGDHAKAKDFVKHLYSNVPLLDSGARGATVSFVQRGIGDVLIAWESEALIALHEMGKGTLELIMPSISIRAEPPVAIVDKVVDRRETRQLAQAYLEFLYSEAGQSLAARHYLRPTLESVANKTSRSFRNVAMFSIDDLFGGWQNAHQIHFAEGGVFDQIYLPGR